ncbi:MAG: helix-turn-helix domain-containing protein [Kiritimatiellae bacterium]|nr:helix-turn-helix domain-containing protein [Kiritimatiellia bacterium]
MKEHTKKYLSLEEVAKLLSVDYQLIYRLVRSGELPAIRVGRVYRIDHADLDAYLTRNKTSGPMLVCAACGTAYGSALSLKQGCVCCGAPLCTDCWDRKGIRRCRDHAEGLNPGVGKESHADGSQKHTVTAR